LREEDREGIGSDSSTTSVGAEHHLAVREGAKEESGEETIFSELRPFKIENQYLMRESKPVRELTSNRFF
jgi:hypothetical protein